MTDRQRGSLKRTYNPNRIGNGDDQLPMHGPARRFFDACRYRCVMMSYGTEQREHDQSREGGMKTQERISKTTTGQRWRLLMPRDVHWRLDLCVSPGGSRGRAASGSTCLGLTG
ncbi:unnamed protein product [Pleuronectes platessa]|uniref:Uncharacterized protein n=1 Tax=Pleuronectes platessa TaxID=8262 RepID=A0A9N7UFT8_PLEPL|nr:unnamed protein product [Pleuronectes platessa]